MEFNDCDSFMRPPSFVTVTFGGVDVQNNHFFRVNGNTTTLTNTSETAVGNTFRFGVPLRLVAFTFHKSNAGQAIFQMIRNQTPSLYIVNGRSGVIVLQSPVTFNTQESIRMRSIVNGGSPAPGAALITMYFYPEQDMLYRPISSESGLCLITFGGSNVNAALSFLRVNGNATSPTSTQPSAGNVFVAGAPMTLLRAVCHKSTVDPTQFIVLRNNTPSGLIAIDRQSGVADISITLNQLDTLQLQYVGQFPPGTCLLTFYARM
jgi:hypothetical protein